MRVITHTVVSTAITMTVVTPLLGTVNVSLTKGANPGCLKDSVTFTASFTNFGVSPSYTWYVDGFPVDSNDLTIDSAFANRDIVTFQVHATDSGCYVHDTMTFPNILMLRDSTPAAPWLSLLGDLIVASDTGIYSWYGPPTGTLIPGAINQSYHPTMLGWYYAIKDTGNCRSDTSNLIYISLLGVNSINTTDVKLYPNPTTGILNLDWGHRTVNMNLDVYNIQGVALIHEDIEHQSQHQTDMSNLPAGNYFVVLRDNEDGSKRTFKVLLTK